jgi:lipopolysaccharide/colanic/teichoic acid biosynthesis glycosyltransferase
MIRNYGSSPHYLKLAETGFLENQPPLTSTQNMTPKRVFDIVFSAAALIVTAPVILLAAVAIRLSSSGPIFYRPQRVGKDGQLFRMHKLRTMVTAQGANSYAITAARDPRIFPVGRLLRVLKVDEFPQFFDVVRGKMSIVGPRPEDPRIVREHYDEDGFLTLTVRPGLTSPGTLYFYAVERQILVGGNPELVYAEKLLPVKLALDAEYVRSMSLSRDMGLVFRTVKSIILAILGRSEKITMPERRPASTERFDIGATRVQTPRSEHVSSG